MQQWVKDRFRDERCLTPSSILQHIGLSILRPKQRLRNRSLNVIGFGDDADVINRSRERKVYRKEAHGTGDP